MPENQISPCCPSAAIPSSGPGELLVKDFSPLTVCTKSGMVDADVRPNWKGEVGLTPDEARRVRTNTPRLPEPFGNGEPD
jgi:hypothetical protein